MIKSNEIYAAYGREYKEMTKRLLVRAELCNEIKPGFRVAIKPNLVVASPAKFGATTHPEIVCGIIEYLKEHGLDNIVIVEGSWVGDKTTDAFEYCGYNDIAKEYGIDIIDTQKDSSYEKDCSGMKLKLCSCTKDFDFLINVPVLKGHCQTKMTCALKNMKGLLPNSEKRRFHTLGLHKPIAHLNTGVHQDFIVIDHICGDPDFEEGGNPLQSDCIMAAKDPVLVDAFACSELGYAAEDIEYVRLASDLGVGCMDLDKLDFIVTEGKPSGNISKTHSVLDVSYCVEDIDSCSACYGMLIGALNRLKDEGLLDKLNTKISIGQGFKGKSGECGIGECTRLFKHHIPGCPPDEKTIYEYLKDSDLLI